jgi:hypothetical protein
MLKKKKYPKIEPKYIYDNADKKIDIIIKFKDFEKIMGQLEDLHDLIMIYERTGKASKTIPYEQLRAELFGNVK